MRIINERTDVACVAERWRAQYPPGSKTARGPTDPIYEALKSLDPATATATDVEKIIGNRSWAGVYSCHECNADVTEVVELGQEPDYESHTAQICHSCLIKAVSLIGSSLQRQGDAK